MGVCSTREELLTFASTEVNHGFMLLVSVELISLAFCMLCFVLCFVCIRFVSSACVHSRYPTTIAATHLNNVWNQNYDSVQRRKHCIKRAKYMNVEERSY